MNTELSRDSTESSTLNSAVQWHAWLVQAQFCVYMSINRPVLSYCSYFYHLTVLLPA